MKKAIPLFLLFVFLFNAMGYFVAFKMAQCEVKKEIKSLIKLNLSTKQLTAIIINKTDLATIEWRENGKELFYKGELFDVVRSKETSTTVVYFCINDKKEKQLFANLEEHISTHIAADKSAKNNTSKKITDHIIKVYYPLESMRMLNTTVKDKVFRSLSFNYLSIPIEKNFPPPEFV